MVQEIAFVLEDFDDYRDPEKREKLHGKVVINGVNNIEIFFDGYGCAEADAGLGSVVMVEFWGSKLRAMLSVDINSADPEIHSLEGSRESLRHTDEAVTTPEV